MTATPQLTLVTITKDDPEGLARTLASTKAWRDLDWVEQIVVDASTPAAGLDDSRIRHVRQTSTGIAEAFNEGLGLARGEWVWFLNGGDEIDGRLSPGWLEALLVSSHAQVIIGATTYAGEAAPRPHLPPVHQWPSLLPWIPHPSCLVQRGLFQRFGDFDRRYSIVMDYDWWLRALSGDVAVDVISVPFAIFWPGGVSQKTESRGRLVRERDEVIRRQQSRLWSLWFLAGKRLFRAGGRALFTRRIGR